ncbi:hypothetical protein [Niastella vici]|nr:hypothetical protein [Niastella vici]
MRFKTLLLLTIGFASLASCSRYITPFEAANGKAKCGRMIR